MPDEGRSCIYAVSTLSFGARALSVPGRGNVLCVSALYAFNLSTGKKVKPEDWATAVAKYAGDLVVPDSMSPLPGAEVMILGHVPPVSADEKKRLVSIHCGPVKQQFFLHSDPEAPDQPFIPDYKVAAWHKKDNPEGRGGEGKNPDLPPLITRVKSPEDPIWLGQTPLDHASRVKFAGTSSASPDTGWAADADPSVLHETHRSFWAETIQPGDPLEYEGLASAPLKVNLPFYRTSIISGDNETNWAEQPTRIQSVMLLPEADLGAVVWRTGIPLGKDSLGVSIIALIAALEDANNPKRDITYWAELAIERWVDPSLSLDETPFLPADLAEAEVSAFAGDKDDVMGGRFEAAKDWVEEEIGVTEDNPFGGPPEEAQQIMDGLQELDKDSGDGLPDMEKFQELATQTLALGKDRHKDAGFVEPPDETEKKPVERTEEELQAEVAKRLKKPYCSERELELIANIKLMGRAAVDPEETVSQLAENRHQSPEPMLFWPALNNEQGEYFGDEIVKELNEGEDLPCHIDVSGAIVNSRNDSVKITNCQLDSLLAEETTWQDVSFVNCTFERCCFTKARFENCSFQDCIFEKSNLSNATITNCQFESCTLSDMQIHELVWLESVFTNCTLKKLSCISPGMRDVKFIGGSWHKLDWVEGVLLELTVSATSLTEIAFNSTTVPASRFEKLEMFKVWAMQKGFPSCVFEEVKAETCGFLAGCHFDDTKFIKTHFIETGFNTALFKNASIAPGCQFNTCDFSIVMFENAELSGVRFFRCTMAMSLWTKTRATDAWFFECILRDVDFSDTELARANFADADLEGVIFQPEKTIAANFLGTKMGSAE